MQFNTPFGWYHFTRMPFGLKSASEVFQKQKEAVFQGTEGIHIVADDIKKWAVLLKNMTRY